MSSFNSRFLATSAALAAGVGTAGALAASSMASTHARASAAAAVPQLRLTAHRLRPRSGVAAPGTVVRSSSLFGDRVFANSRDGFALAQAGDAQYPARTTDGGRTWRIDGPQLHVDAADGPEAVGSVGDAAARTFFAYGSSVIDATSDGGRSWWQTFPSGFVVAVVRGRLPHELVAYVQRSASNAKASPVVTSQYVSRDGGRNWTYSGAMGG